MKYFRFFCITLLLLLLTSCQNFFSGSDDLSSSSKSARNYVSFTGNISLEGAYPQEFVSNIDSNNSTIRTAFPSLPAETFYRVTASKNNTVVFSANSNSSSTDISFASDNSTFTIRQLETGVEWTITVSIHFTMDSTNNFPLMSDSFPKTFSMENNVLTHDFVLKPELTDGDGDLDLRFTLPADKIDTINTTCLSSNKDSWTGEITYPAGATSATLYKSGITTGSYLVQFDFIKDDYIVYSDIQTINIFKNMNTGTWVNNGGSEAIQTDGTYVVTQAMIDDFALTQIYVGTNSWGTASSNGTGSRFAPFDTLQKAIDYIGVAGKSTKNYTIWVSGGVNGGAIQGNTTLGDSLNGKSKSITIRGLNGLNEDEEPLDYLTGYADKLNNVTHNNNDVQDYNGITVDDIFETGEFAPVLKIYSSSDISLDIRLKDIGISKGAARQGAGIHLNGAHVKLTINEGTFISDNHSIMYAGGLYVEGIASCIMNGGKITENSTYHSGSASSGGGIQIANGGSFTMNAGEISNNRAMNFGGGVSLKTSATETINQSRFTMNGGKITGNYANGVTPAPNNTKSGYGGAVYIHDGTFTMTAGEISGNYTNCEAGAVYIAGELDTSAAFDMQGGIIKENTLNDAPDTSKCSGIYLRSKAFKIKGNSFIPKSNDKHIIYLASGKTIDINGTLAPTSDGTATGTAENVAAVINLEGIYQADREVLTGDNQTNINSASGMMIMTNRAWLISQGKLAEGVIAAADELQDILTSLFPNGTSTAYNVIILDSAPNLSDLKTAINNGGKYINLSFPNATFTSLNYNLSSNKIVNITIPASVTSASGFSRYYSNLQNIYVESNNNNYKSLNGVLYSHDGKTLVDYPPKKTGTTYTIPENTENIGSNAFYGNTTITSITIPDYVQTIGESAFESATALTSVSLGTGITNLSSRVFYGTKFTTITLPASIETIGSNTQPFYANEALQEIIVDSENQNFKSVDGVVYSKDGKELCIYPSAKADTSYTILSGTTSIRYESFHKTANLTKISIPEGITEIVGNAFRECTKIDTVVLPSTMTTIQQYAFAVSGGSIQTVYFRGTEEQQTALKTSIQNKNTGLPSTGWECNYTGN